MHACPPSRLPSPAAQTETKRNGGGGGGGGEKDRCVRASEEKKHANALWAGQVSCLGQSANRRHLHQRLAHLPRHLQLLLVFRRFAVGAADAFFDRVLEHFGDLVWSVQDRECDARDEVPCVQW